jgi:hypothetical protein
MYRKETDEFRKMYFFYHEGFARAKQWSFRTCPLTIGWLKEIFTEEFNEAVKSRKSLKKKMVWVPPGKATSISNNNSPSSSMPLVMYRQDERDTCLTCSLQVPYTTWSFSKLQKI